MNDEKNRIDSSSDRSCENCESDLMTRIENAYRVYRLSEVFLNDVEHDYGRDYGKLKIARLRFEFAQHELLSVLKEAREKGVNWNENEFVQKFFHPDNYRETTRDIT